MAIFNNLPGIFLDALDGQLTVYPDSGEPKFLILGTSDTVPSDYSEPYTVTSFNDVKTGFGTNGTLYKTMVEAQAGGASNFVLWRVGDSDDTTQGKRKVFEELFKAYAYMYDQEMDAVIPGGVYLDDANVMDMTNANATAVALAVLAGTDLDTLGMFHAKEIAGEWEFAWWFPKSVTSPVFDTSGSANGEYTAPNGTNIDRTDLTIDSFHEVNFAYQLAEFCHRGSEVVDMRLGFIGVQNISDSVTDGVWGDVAKESLWVGKAPTVDSGNVVTTDGTGLLGNKFLSGRAGDAAGPPAFKATANYKGQGGFFASDEDSATNRCYLDETEKLDSNGAKIDIGKYLCIVG